MEIYMINYDLHKPGQNYSSLFKEIQLKECCHAMESCWLVYTNENAEMLYNRLCKHIDKNDHILVSNFGNDRQGWLPKNVWEWIDTHSTVSSFY